MLEYSLCIRSERCRVALSPGSRRSVSALRKQNHQENDDARMHNNSIIDIRATNFIYLATSILYSRSRGG